MATFNKYNCFVLDLASAKHQMQTGTTHVFKVALTNTPPNAATHKVLADITEIAAGNGYTAGGLTAGTVTGAQASGTFTMSLGTQPQWTAVTGTMATFRYAVLYNSTPTGGLLIGWWDYASGVSLDVGSTFQVQEASPVITIGP